MTEEEQFAFWSTMNYDVMRKLIDSEVQRKREMASIEEKLDLLLSRTTALGIDLRAGFSSLTSMPQTSQIVEMPTASLSLTSLCWVHRILTEASPLPEELRGRFRAIGVWIGLSGSTQDTAEYVPPPPSEIVRLTQDWLDWWHGRHRELRGRSRDEIIAGLAEFHHRLLRIHPFLDANGRVARVLLDQAARELLDQAVGREFTEDVADYYHALKAADRGDLSPLQSRISAALS
jgi:Fic family protein